MFRFYPEAGNISILQFLLFQYILCFGFTHGWHLCMVGDQIFQYILCFGFTQFQLLSIPHPELFQYILCFGFTHSLPFKFPKSSNFNTSYVSVLRTIFIAYLQLFPISIHPMFRFYQEQGTHQGQNQAISIHPMFRFYSCFNSVKILFSQFQYILCFGLTEYESTKF